MKKGCHWLTIFYIILSAFFALAETTGKPFPSPYLQDYCWMRLAQVVPAQTDRVILLMGTVEPHGACAIGADNYIPLKMADTIWEKCNALIAPAINHGVTGAVISQYPGAITIRPEVFEEYVYDVLKHLVRSGFRNVLILNGHGGNTDLVKKAMTRLHLETSAHFLIFDWWTSAFNITNEVYGTKAQQSGHGDKEEAALVMAYDPKLVDREMYEKLGKENVGREGLDTGIYAIPSLATSRYSEKDSGYLDFDLNKAREYMHKKADFIANTFLEAVKRWEMLDNWKKGK